MGASPTSHLTKRACVYGEIGGADVESSQESNSLPDLPGADHPAEARDSPDHRNVHDSSDSDFVPSVPASSSPATASGEVPKPESLVTHCGVAFLNYLCHLDPELQRAGIVAEPSDSRLTIMIAGQQVYTTPDISVLLNYKSRSFRVLDVECKLHNSWTVYEQSFGQQVAHLLGRAHHMKILRPCTKYEVALVGLHQTSLSVLRATIRDEYLQSLQDTKDLQDIGKHAPTVLRFGPIDVADASRRHIIAKAICELLRARVARFKDVLDKNGKDKQDFRRRGPPEGQV